MHSFADNFYLWSMSVVYSTRENDIKRIKICFISRYFCSQKVDFFFLFCSLMELVIEKRAHAAEEWSKKTSRHYIRQAEKKQNIAVTIEYFDHKTDACIGFFFVSFLTQLCWSRVRQTFVSLIIDVISRSLNVDVRIVYEVIFF
jgi:hypothetical protein